MTAPEDAQGRQHDRDVTGKGGTIQAITERVSPRVSRVVALQAPSDREKSQMYIQRYVEHVMGFCTNKQYEGFREN